MKAKCRKCRGKGEVPAIRSRWGDLWRTCMECLGKGTVWGNNKPKKKPKERT